MAAASNALSGALAYYLAVLQEPTTPNLQHSALRPALDLLRVLRRADACFNVPSRPRPELA
jgi:hypothetical protein